jgi:type I restriction enzyme S subunit
MIKLIKLGEIATFSQGQQIPIPIQNTEKFDGCDTFLRIINYTQNTDDYRYIPKQNPKYLVNKEDIVMVRYGAVGFVGRGLSGVLANNLFKVNYKKELVNGDFLYRALWSGQVQKQLLNASQSTSMAALNFTSVAKIQIPLPPLETQQKIAAILDAADTLRQKDKALLAKYDELTQSLFLDMFGDPVSNPKGWEKVELGDVSKKITDGEHQNPTAVEEGKHLVMAKDVLDDRVDFSNPRFVSDEDFKKYISKCKPEFGDIVLVSRGATVGRCTIVNTDIPFCLMGSVILIKKSDAFKGEFISSLLKNNKFLKQLTNVSSASAQQAIYISHLKKLKIILPHLTIQNQFAERIAIIEQQKAIAQASLEKSEELFNSLLQKAFKGELV